MFYERSHDVQCISMCYLIQIDQFRSTSHHFTRYHDHEHDVSFTNMLTYTLLLIFEILNLWLYFDSNIIIMNVLWYLMGSCMTFVVNKQISINLSSFYWHLLSWIYMNVSTSILLLMFKTIIFESNIDTIMNIVNILRYMMGSYIIFSMNKQNPVNVSSLHW